MMIMMLALPAISRIDGGVGPTPAVADGVATVDDAALGGDAEGPQPVQVIGHARVVRLLW